MPDRQFANELLGIALGTVLGVPLFDAAFVSISPALMQASPPLAAARYAPGVHFGSRMPSAAHFNFQNVSPILVRSNISNVDDFYRLTVFDELSYHQDRAGNPRNLVAVQLHAAIPQLEFFAIDHGLLFGSHVWTVATIDATPLVPIVPVMAAVKEVLTSRARLAAAAHEAASLLSRLSAAVDQARTNLTADEKAAITRLLSRRAPQLEAWATGPAYSNGLPMLT
jgi:hypothetical protein